MINTSLILWGLLFSCVGFAYYLYGKRQSNNVVRYVGIGLMVFPYFVSDVIIFVVVGVLLMVSPMLIKP